MGLATFRRPQAQDAPVGGIRSDFLCGSSYRSRQQEPFGNQVQQQLPRRRIRVVGGQRAREASRASRWRARHDAQLQTEARRPKG
jgi:hypothetical protein